MSRKLGFAGSVFVLATFVLASTAWAQVQSGSIVVKATDPQGAIVPGATVTLTGSVMPAPQTAVTDTTGVVRFISLQVGTYAVKVSLQGFETVNRTDILVTQSQTVSIDVALKIGTVSTEVTVSAASPIVDTKAANVSVNLDAKLLDTTPGGKDIWNILEYKVPGIVFDTPDVGGNQGGLQRGFTSRGTPNSQNVQLLNGVNVGDPAAIGFSMNYYEPSTFKNIQVTTGAQDISMGTSGTLINMVTRSGTNRFGGQTLGTYQGHQTQWDNIDENLKKLGLKPGAQGVGYISNFNAQGGGPLVKNKLFYFGSSNDQRTHVNVPGYPAVSPPQIPQTLSGNTQDTTDITSITGKLSYALNAVNRLETYGNYQWYKKPNRGAGTGTTLDSNTAEDDTFAIIQGSWNTVIGGRLFGDSVLNYNNTHFPLNQKTNLQSILDNSTNIRLRNATGSQHDVPAPRAAHLELAVLDSPVPRRAPRLQGRIRQRLHAGNRHDDARGQRESDVPQPAGHRDATARCCSGGDLQLTDGRGTRGEQLGAVSAGFLLVEPLDADRWRPVGARRGHDSAAGA